MEFYRQLGQRIKLAREQAGLSQEALGQQVGKLSSSEGYSGSAIWHFESGKRRIQLEDLPYFAAALGVPMGYLMGDSFAAKLSPVPQLDAVLLRATASISPLLRGEVRTFIDHAIAYFVKSMPSSELAGFWPLDADELLSRLGMVPPIDPYEIAERCGVLVQSWDFGDEISGLLIHMGPLRAIGVNRQHPETRRRFTVAHELGHYFLRHNLDLAVDLVDPFGESHFSPRLEREANRFAAQLLMPERYLRADFRAFGGDHDELRRKYDVSEQALWIRLSELRLVETPSW